MDTQGDFLPAFLSGSQRKTAFALRKNCEKMIEEDGIDTVGFLTLTVGDFDEWGRFHQVRDSAEASRRINNLNRRVLSKLFRRAVLVTERHKSLAIHFHLIGSLACKSDIRTGLDFKAVRRRNYRSVSPELRAIWKELRQILPQYGFGRAELLPVRTCGEAMASYAAKYIEKNVCNRLESDKRKKLVRYLGWEKRQLKANEFSWGTERARAWRWKARTLCRLIGFDDRETAAKFLGARWAFTLTKVWIGMCGDDLFPGILWDSWMHRERVRMELVRAVGRNRAMELDQHIKPDEFRDSLEDWGPVRAPEFPRKASPLPGSASVRGVVEFRSFSDRWRDLHRLGNVATVGACLNQNSPRLKSLHSYASPQELPRGI